MVINHFFTVGYSKIALQRNAFIDLFTCLKNSDMQNNVDSLRDLIQITMRKIKAYAFCLLKFVSLCSVVMGLINTRRLYKLNDAVQAHTPQAMILAYP